MNATRLQKTVAAILVIEGAAARSTDEGIIPKGVAAVRTRDACSENTVAIAHDNLSIV
jgi:hypothetical protein